MDVDLDVVREVEDDRVAALGWLGRRMERQPDLRSTLRELVQQARMADLADAVGVLMVRDRSIAVAVASDLDVRRADQLQLDCSQGPGVEAILTRRTFVSDDLRLDARWRFWGPRAAAVGWLSVLSVRLADGDTFGSLNLYSRQVSSFGPADLAVAEAFAGHAAVSLARVRERRLPVPESPSWHSAEDQTCC
jgi:GAF domain-containing protein